MDVRAGLSRLWSWIFGVKYIVSVDGVQVAQVRARRGQDIKVSVAPGFLVGMGAVAVSPLPPMNLKLSIRYTYLE